ncbi:MAG: hypothetical protein Ct9H90mP23_1750 [Methanobacteriota archaeon]|nr:MAG: hypothetical protein Ct9H90mP23_1750 [Euryarchaeota archaeon]
MILVMDMGVGVSASTAIQTEDLTSPKKAGKLATFANVWRGHMRPPR